MLDCLTLFHKLFPSSEGAVQNTLSKIERELDTLYEELKNEQAHALELREARKKLEDPRKEMDPSGISRKDAMRNLDSKLSRSLKKIGTIQHQIRVFVNVQTSVEQATLHATMDERMKFLRQELQVVKGLNPKSIEDNLDFLTETNDAMTNINNLVNDTMVSGWSIDENDDQLLHDFLNDPWYDDPESEKHAVDEGETSTEESKPRETQVVAPAPRENPKETIQHASPLLSF